MLGRIHIFMSGLSLNLAMGAFTSCSKFKTGFGVKSNPASRSAAITKVVPIVAKPGDLVKVISTNFSLSGAYSFSLPLKDGSAKIVKIDVKDQTTGTFTMPEGAGLGLKTVDYSNGSKKQGSFSIVADQNTNNLPILITEESKVCSTETYIDRNGDTKTGTKDCSAGVSECKKDGEIGCKTNASIVGADKSLALPTNIRSGITLAGVSGNLSASGYEPDPWDLRAGVTVGSVTGKLYVNCRNRSRAAVYNYDGVVTSISNLGVNAGSTLDYWDTIEDYNNGTAGLPTSVITGWTSNDCQGVEASAGDTNVWKDVSNAGSGAASCTGSPENCTMKDKISGLQWSKQPNFSYANSTTVNASPTLTVSSTAGLVPNMIVSGTGIPGSTYILSVDSGTQLTMSANATASASNVTVTVNNARWNGAINYCDALNHNGATDWRLPTQKELMDAYNHGIRSAASANWIAEGNMDGNPFWSASSVSLDTDYAWNVYLADGLTNYNVKENGYFLACVR